MKRAACSAGLAVMLLSSAACTADEDAANGVGESRASHGDASSPSTSPGSSGSGDDGASRGDAARAGGNGAAAQSAKPVAEPAALSATAKDDTVVVLDEPGGTKTHDFDNPTETGVPLTFMVVGAQQGWVEVQLPVRPNGTTGWVEETDVDLATISYELRVSTTKNRLTLLNDGKVIGRFDAATGTGETPTPTGRYYLTELIEPTNPGYGDYAYGVSAFSDVLNEFGGGPGQIGLHGTTEIDTIGDSVSHGCIRLSNEDITTLTTLLPLGTPIDIS